MGLSLSERDKKVIWHPYAPPNEKEWEVILNPELKQWGAYGYDKIKDKDLPHIKVPVKKLDQPVEKLTLRFDDKNSLVIEWDQTHIEVPIQS